jgi:hypothetical protein
MVTRIAKDFATEREADITIKARQTEYEIDKTIEMRKNGSLPENGFYLNEAYAYIQKV